MKIKFELNESKVEGIKYYGKLVLSCDDDEITIDITVRKGEDELYVCYPSKKSTKDDKYYNTVFMSEKLYKRINKELNKKFD